MTDPEPDQSADRSPDQAKEIADKTVEAGIADEGAAYAKAIAPTQGGTDEDESEAQPS